MTKDLTVTGYPRLTWKIVIKTVHVCCWMLMMYADWRSVLCEASCLHYLLPEE